jgi:hypothetical protein
MNGNSLLYCGNQFLRLTQRAADGGESAALICSFKALAVFWSQAFVPSRPPSAANASRWAFLGAK